MSKSRRMAWVLVLMAAVVLGSIAVAGAAEKEPKWGVVDVSKLMEAPRVKQYGEEFKAVTEGLDAKLSIRGQKLMLADAEIKELVDLKTKTTPTDADKNRIKALEDTEKQRDGELKQLQETASANDQQKARLKELLDMRQKSKDAGEQIQKDYEGLAQAKLKEINDKIEAEVQEAVNKVAEEKGFATVFNKAAVLYGGVDLTDAVMAKLDRKPK